MLHPSQEIWVYIMLLPLKLQTISMDEEEKKRLKHRYQYLSLNYQIMQIRMKGQNPPKDLIDHALEVGLLAEIPEEELNSL